MLVSVKLNSRRTVSTSQTGSRAGGMRFTAVNLVNSVLVRSALYLRAYDETDPTKMTHSAIVMILDFADPELSTAYICWIDEPTNRADTIVGAVCVVLER